MRKRWAFRLVDAVALLAAVGGGYAMVRGFRDLALVPVGFSPEGQVLRWALGGLGGLTMAAGIAMYWRKKWSRWYLTGAALAGALAFPVWAWELVPEWESGADPAAAVKFWGRVGAGAILLVVGFFLLSRLGSRQFEIKREKNPF